MNRQAVAAELLKIAKELSADLLVDKPAGFDAALAEFVAFCQGVVTHDQKTNYPNLPYETKLSTTEGGRFVRIVASSPAQRSAWAFIDKANGDVLKPAAWSAPAKHARGNIFDKNSWRTIGPFGPAYMR